MKNYLLIESQGAFDVASAPAFVTLARDLTRMGNNVEVFLVQNGVMPARAGARGEYLVEAARAGAKIWADEFSMKERALAPAQLMRGVETASIGVVIDKMADGWSAIWH
jgi:predicted peroxiredoxin